MATIGGGVTTGVGSGECRPDEACCRAVRWNRSISANEIGRGGATSSERVG